MMRSGEMQLSHLKMIFYHKKTNFGGIKRKIPCNISFQSSLTQLPCGATQDRWVMVERSDRMWSTGEGNGKSLQYSCLENPMKIGRASCRERV